MDGRLSAFLPSTELPAAYAWVVAATVVSQVVGGPLAAIFLGPIDGAAGRASRPSLFGGGLRWALADGPAKAGWLTPDKVAWLGARHAEDEAAARARTGEVAGETAAPTPKILADALLVIRRWQVWLLACMLATVQLAYFAVLFFTPLLISTAFGAAGAGSKPGADTKALAAHTARTALKSTAVYGPAAAAVILAGWVSRRTGDRRWSCVSTLALSCVAFGVLPAVAARSSPGAALATLAVAAAGGVASLAVLTTWPGDYVAAAASYAFFNAFAAVGGFAGPYLMGALTFSRACAVMAACQGVAGAVLFVFGTWEAARLARVAGAGLAPAGPSGRLVGPAHSAPLV